MFASRSRLEATCRLPLIAVTADRIKAKERLHRIHARVMLYADFRFAANNSASRLYAMVVSFPRNYIIIIIIVVIIIVIIMAIAIVVVIVITIIITMTMAIMNFNVYIYNKCILHLHVYFMPSPVILQFILYRRYENTEVRIHFRVDLNDNFFSIFKY